MLTKNLFASTLIIVFVPLTKNECPPDQNFVQSNQIAVWLSQLPQKVESVYKISTSMILFLQFEFLIEIALFKKLIKAK